MLVSGCKVLPGKVTITDAVNDLSMLQFRAVRELSIDTTNSLISLDGLQQTFVRSSFTVTSNTKLLSLALLGKLGSKLQTLTINSNSVLRDLNGLHDIVEVVEPVEIRRNDLLQSLAGLGNLQSAGAMRITHNNELKSLHGLEGLRSVPSYYPRWGRQKGSIAAQDMAKLESISALASLSGVMAGDIIVDRTPVLNSVHALLQGITGICSEICTSSRGFTMRRLGQGPWESAMSSDFCFPSEQRAAFLQMIGGWNYALPDAEWNQSNCHYCPQPCGILPSGYPVQCDYEVGRCGCPLGTVGENCSLTAPTVRIVPGQAKQCVKPHLQEGQSATCTICIDVMTDDYAFDLLNPPTSFEIRESGNSGILSGAQQNVEWQNATHGSVCIIISVFASEVSTGSQAMNLVLGYTKFAQDCLLPGTLRSPLLNPVEPMYPWCLDSGDCTSTSVEGGVAILEIQEPPIGQPRFAESEHVFDEGSLGSLVLSREGGNYSALTTTVRINTTLSSAVAGVNYEFQDAVVSWPHLDSTPKSIAITFPDNNIFEANPSLTLHLVPSVQIGGQILLRIADNGDGGRLGFSSQRITRPETAPQSASCLVNVRQVSAE